MRSALGFVAAGVLVALTMDMALADGARRSWRVYRHGIGAISHDVITPWYVGYNPLIIVTFAPIPCLVCRSSFRIAGTGALDIAIGRVGSWPALRNGRAGKLGAFSSPHSQRTSALRRRGKNAKSFISC
jgi:hypothetical protein